MSKWLIGCAVLALAVILVAGLMVGGIYNRLVGLNEGVDSAWAQVENVYQRRADLIPNLVSTVKGAAEFEKETLESVIEARARATQVNISAANAPQTAEQLKQFQEAQGELSSALSRLLVTVERYPDIKANANFRDLQAQLEGTENRIAVARGRYIDTVAEYNKLVRYFPTNLTARFLLGAEVRPTFEAREGTDK